MKGSSQSHPVLAEATREGLDTGMVERVAKAICDEEWSGTQPWGRKPESFHERYRATARAALEAAQAPRVLAALIALEPYLDAIVCYASTMDEHEPNRLAVDARKAIGAALGKPS